MDREPNPHRLAEILANLSREIREPLDCLQAELGFFLASPDPSIPEAESALARTMTALCDDIRQLTGECLDGRADEAPA